MTAHALPSHGSAAGALPRTPAAPTAAQVALLQCLRSYPSVSLLMSTTPASRLTADDAATLRHLLQQAARRLQEEDAGRYDGVMRRLEREALRAADGPTAAALAVFVSTTHAELVHLPVAVQDRVVVDPTFATRDLVRALHRTPRHVVLVLTAVEARLFDGVADGLRPAVGGAFPRVAGTDPHRDRRSRGDHERTTRWEASSASFLRDVDRALGTYLRAHPAPLVLVGPERLLASFRRTSRNLGRLAGVVTGSHATAPLPELAARIRPVLDAYLHSRQQEALDLLERRVDAARAVSGLPAAWLAARHERVEMLAVDDTLLLPARLAADGDLLVPAEDTEHPDVLDDAVDELIELVLDRGGWVALVEPGALDAHGGVALTLRASG